MQTTYIFLSILKGLIVIGGFIATIYFIATNSKDKKNLKKAFIAFAVTFIGVILLTAIEFAVAI
jgi:hypothetical protein